MKHERGNVAITSTLCNNIFLTPTILYKHLLYLHHVAQTLFNKLCSNSLMNKLKFSSLQSTHWPTIRRIDIKPDPRPG